MSEVLCKGVVHWCTELAARRSDHELVIHDDLQRRLLGFHDNTDETVFYLGLHFLQKAEEGDTDALGMSLSDFRQCIRTPKGRFQLLNPNSGQ